jgi:hypothetical protein
MEFGHSQVLARPVPGRDATGSRGNMPKALVIDAYDAYAQAWPRRESEPPALILHSLYPEPAGCKSTGEVALPPAMEDSGMLWPSAALAALAGCDGLSYSPPFSIVNVIHTCRA